MARKIPGTAITANTLPATAIVANTITTTQLQTTVVNQISAGGAPKITNVQIANSTYSVLDDTAVDTGGGYIVITGTGFESNSSVLVDNTLATSVTYVSSTVLRAQVPAKSAGTYNLYVVNSDGGVGIKVVGLTYSAAPAWSTSSTLTAGNSGLAYSNQLSATDATSYALQSGSSLPSGLTLSSGGLLSGTVNVGSQTTYTFTIVATDAQLQDSSRTFSLTINTFARSFTISPSVSGKSTWDLDVDGPLNLPNSGSWTITTNTSASLQMSAKIWGAGGGAQDNSNGGGGGGGGYSSGTLTLPGNSSFIVRVGGGGRGTSGGDGGFTNAYPRASGGGGKSTTSRSTGGGGYSGIFVSSETQANSILLAGGGGGGGSGAAQPVFPTGGAGGGTSGVAGTNYSGSLTGGGAGTQVAGGAGGTGSWGSPTLAGAGSALQGGEGTGNGGFGTNGGGGGYFGGGAGANDYGSNANEAAAGGGSGFINPTYVSSGVTTAGSGSTPANSGDAVRGNSGNGGAQDTSQSGQDGRVYFY